jgi:hypothetical protein
MSFCDSGLVMSNESKIHSRRCTCDRESACRVRSLREPLPVDSESARVTHLGNSCLSLLRSRPQPCRRLQHREVLLDRALLEQHAPPVTQETSERSLEIVVARVLPGAFVS